MDKEKGGKPLYLLKCLLIAYIMTAGLLFLLALLVYKLHISEKMVSAIVIVIYIAVNFTAGFFTGKHMQTRKFLWGLLMGTAYFVVLAIVSLIVDHSLKSIAADFLTVLVLCAGSGMLGGMFG